MMKKIIIATNNEGKTNEIKEILKTSPFEFLSLKDIGLKIEVVEDQKTFEGNALKKAKEIMQATGEITLADDSGLVIASLDGLPGVDSAIFAGISATSVDNYSKVLKLMEGFPPEKRKAVFWCVIIVAFPNGNLVEVKESCEGSISLLPKGDGGFGYDPIFIPKGFENSFAQLGPCVKNQISHRAKALQKLAEILPLYYDEKVQE